jgi:uncharacterized protein (UPF0335 family)
MVNQSSEQITTKSVIERAKEEFDVELNEREAEEIRQNVKDVIDKAGKSGYDSASAFKLIGNRIQKVVHAKEFSKAFYVAEALFKQCNPDGDFYTMDEGPEELITYLEKRNIKRQEDGHYFSPTPHGSSYIGHMREIKFIIFRLKLLINKLGTPVVGKKCFYIKHTLADEEREITESVIINVTKDSHFTIKGQSGFCEIENVFSTLEEAEKRMANYFRD